MCQAPDDFKLKTNFSEYWKTIANTRPHQSIVDAITAAGFGWVFSLGQVRHDGGLLTAFIER